MQFVNSTPVFLYPIATKVVETRIPDGESMLCALGDAMRIFSTQKFRISMHGVGVRSVCLRQ